MKHIRLSMIVVAVALSGCATGDALEGQRTVFSNPYVAPVIDQAGIGPECNLAQGQDATCLGIPLTRKGRGNAIGGDSFGSYNRNQRRVLRERAELLRQISEQQRQEQSAPQPPPEPTLPTAADGSETP